MRAHHLALIWLGGDLEFRPSWLAREHVLRVALRDPVKAAEIVAELNDGSRSLTCGRMFAVYMAEYRVRPHVWRLHEKQKWKSQKIIDGCLRRSDGTAAWPMPGRGAAWSAAA
jgi:hypothetical protein